MNKIHPHYGSNDKKPADPDQQLANSNQQWVASGDRILEDFKTLVADSEEFLRSTANVSGDMVTVARNRFEKQWLKAAEKLDEAKERAKASGRQAAAAADHYIHEKPWTAVKIAGGIGLLTGLLMSRRSRNN